MTGAVSFSFVTKCHSNFYLLRLVVKVVSSFPEVTMTAVLLVGAGLCAGVVGASVWAGVVYWRETRALRRYLDTCL